jgi:hypothetical protein
MATSQKKRSSRSKLRRDVHCRCRKSSCRKRFQGEPDSTPCPSCGSPGLRDPWANQRPWRGSTCYCDGYPYPHREARGKCKFNLLLALPPNWQERIEVNRKGCWVWCGEINRNGYGRVWHQGKRHMAHIATYVRLVGEYDRALVLDHTCRNRSCCNPKHLEPVTVRVNTLRGQAVLFRSLSNERDGSLPLRLAHVPDHQGAAASRPASPVDG